VKTIKIAVSTAASVLLMSPMASAHISIHPNTVPAGAFATLDVRVPGEQQGAHVTKVDMLFPPGFTSVDYEPVPGWSVKIVERKLTTPVVDDGETIDAEIARLVWTWRGPLGETGHGQFVQFPLSVAIPHDAVGEVLEFRTVQSYSNGEVDHWIDPSPQAEHPSPRIDVTARGGAIEDVAGDEVGPPAHAAGSGSPKDQSTSAGANGSVTTGGSNRASKGLAIAALALGALGLFVGILAILGLPRRAVAR
jgi:uncharacterized protein YcnI